MTTPKLLLIMAPDHPNAARGEWHQALSKFDTHVVAYTGASSLSTPEADFDAALVFADIPEVDAMDVLDVLHCVDPDLPVLFHDPEMRAGTAARLSRAGAYHCVGYRDAVEELSEWLDSAVEAKRSARRRRTARAATAEPWRSILVGSSKPMETVVEAIRLVGPRRCTVLITGETGTGKEMAARAIHMASPRANQALVAVNCSALPENLLEAELFGHVKGAFTGAIQTRIGRFEQANRGTLFLDEIGDMPLELQAKLLRVLQDRVVFRLGSSDGIAVDVRVIAATNVNLKEKVRQGKFREDLFYRLNVVPLEMPPLKRRDSDIPALVEHFVRKSCTCEGLPIKRVPPETMTRLRAQEWPGNIRQLENAVEMAVVMSGEREVLTARDFGITNPVTISVATGSDSRSMFDLPESMDFDTAVSTFERAMLEQALMKTSGNKTAAAELLGLKRTTLIMKLRTFDGSLRYAS